MNPFTEGEWIQWTTESHTKRGEVIRSSGPSIVVRWLGGEEQTFPLVEPWLGSGMVVIARPKEASRIERESRRGHMSVARAAATLGTTPKRVRAMLRSGQLEGEQRDGKWVSVVLPS